MSHIQKFSCDSLAPDHSEDYPREVKEVSMRLSSHTHFQYADAGPVVALALAGGRRMPGCDRRTSTPISGVSPAFTALAPALARRPMP